MPTLQQATGLTRMHFAARLNGVTGLQPSRTPLLCRRIERAQEMLVGTVLSLVDAALSVQFQTQAHFPNRVETLLGPTAGLNGASPLPFRPDRLQHDVQLAAPTAG